MLRADSRPRRSPEAGGALLWILLLLLLGVVGGMVYLLRAPLFEAMADGWVVDEPLEKAQVVIVLGGDDVKGSRVREAALLYRDGWAPRVLLSGGPLRSYFSEVDLMERDALNWGVPKEHLILVPHSATSTLEEASALAPVLAEHKFRQVILVTSNFHTRRARRIFQRMYRSQGVQVLVHAAPDAHFDPSGWWQDREARAAFLLEVVKSLHTLWELYTLPPAQPAEVSRSQP